MSDESARAAGAVPAAALFCQVFAFAPDSGNSETPFMLSRLGFGPSIHPPKTTTSSLSESYAAEKWYAPALLSPPYARMLHDPPANGYAHTIPVPSTTSRRSRVGS